MEYNQEILENSPRINRFNQNGAASIMLVKDAVKPKLSFVQLSPQRNSQEVNVVYNQVNQGQNQLVQLVQQKTIPVQLERVQVQEKVQIPVQIERVQVPVERVQVPIQTVEIKQVPIIQVPKQQILVQASPQRLEQKIVEKVVEKPVYVEKQVFVENRKEIESLQNNQKLLQEEVQQLKNENLQQLQSIFNLENEVLRLKNLCDQGEGWKDKYFLAETDLASIKDQYYQSLEEINKYKEHIHELEAQVVEIENYEEQIVRLQLDQDGFKQKFVESEQILTETKALYLKSKENEERLLHVQDDNEILQRQLKNKLEEISALESRLKIVNDENYRLRLTIDQKQQEHEANLQQSQQIVQKIVQQDAPKGELENQMRASMRSSRQLRASQYKKDKVNAPSSLTSDNESLGLGLTGSKYTAPVPYTAASNADLMNLGLTDNKINYSQLINPNQGTSQSTYLLPQNNYNNLSQNDQDSNSGSNSQIGLGLNRSKFMASLLTDPNAAKLKVGSPSNQNLGTSGLQSIQLNY